MHGHHFGRGPPPQQPPPHHDHGHHYGPQAPFSTPSNATANSQPAAEPAAEKTTSSGEGSVALAAPVITPFTLQPVKVSTPGYVQSSFLKLGPCGGTGGEPFSTPLDENTKLLSVKVWEGPDGLAGIQAKYELSGEITTSPIWGTSQQDTENFNEVTFDAEQGEILISISGTFGESSEGKIVVVRSLILVTNVATYGPMGNATDTAAREFCLSAGNEGQIIGFFGFSGALLESIGVLAKPPPPPAPVAPPTYELVLQGPSGGVNGNEFTMNVDAYTKFTEIRLFHNKSGGIACLLVDYKIVNGQSKTSGILGTSNVVGYSGSAFTSTVVKFPEACSITCVRGVVGMSTDSWGPGNSENGGTYLAVKSLTFVTDDGVTYGPYGSEEGGTPFSYTGRIVGFHGRHDLQVYSLGVIIAREL